MQRSTTQMPYGFQRGRSSSSALSAFSDSIVESDTGNEIPINFAYIIRFEQGVLLSRICQFLPSGDVVSNVSVVSKEVLRALKGFPLRLDKLLPHAVSLKDLSKCLGLQSNLVMTQWGVSGIRLELGPQEKLHMIRSSPEINMDELRILYINDMRFKVGHSEEKKRGTMTEESAKSIAALLDRGHALEEIYINVEDNVIDEHQACALVAVLQNRTYRYKNMYTNLLERCPKDCSVDRVRKMWVHGILEGHADRAQVLSCARSILKVENWSGTTAGIIASAEDAVGYRNLDGMPDSLEGREAWESKGSSMLVAVLEAIVSHADDSIDAFLLALQLIRSCISPLLIDRDEEHISLWNKGKPGRKMSSLSLAEQVNEDEEEEEVEEEVEVEVEVEGEVEVEAKNSSSNSFRSTNSLDPTPTPIQEQEEGKGDKSLCEKSSIGSRLNNNNLSVDITSPASRKPSLSRFASVSSLASSRSSPRGRWAKSTKYWLLNEETPQGLESSKSFSFPSRKGDPFSRQQLIRRVWELVRYHTTQGAQEFLKFVVTHATTMGRDGVIDALTFVLQTMLHVSHPATTDCFGQVPIPRIGSPVPDQAKGQSHKLTMVCNTLVLLTEVSPEFKAALTSPDSQMIELMISYLSPMFCIGSTGVYGSSSLPHAPLKSPQSTGSMLSVASSSSGGSKSHNGQGPRFGLADSVGSSSFLGSPRSRSNGGSVTTSPTAASQRSSSGIGNGNGPYYWSGSESECATSGDNSTKRQSDRGASKRSNSSNPASPTSHITASSNNNIVVDFKLCVAACDVLYVLSKGVYKSHFVAMALPALATVCSRADRVLEEDPNALEPYLFGEAPSTPAPEDRHHSPARRTERLINEQLKTNAVEAILAACELVSALMNLDATRDYPCVKRQARCIGLVLEISARWAKFADEESRSYIWEVIVDSCRVLYLQAPRVFLEIPALTDAVFDATPDFIGPARLWAVNLCGVLAQKTAGRQSRYTDALIMLAEKLIVEPTQQDWAQYPELASEILSYLSRSVRTQEHFEDLLECCLSVMRDFHSHVRPELLLLALKALDQGLNQTARDHVLDHQAFVTTRDSTWKLYTQLAASLRNEPQLAMALRKAVKGIVDNCYHFESMQFQQPYQHY